MTGTGGDSEFAPPTTTEMSVASVYFIKLCRPAAEHAVLSLRVCLAHCSCEKSTSFVHRRRGRTRATPALERTRRTPSDSWRERIPDHGTSSTTTTAVLPAAQRSSTRLTYLFVSHELPKTVFSNNTTFTCYCLRRETHHVTLGATWASLHTTRNQNSTVPISVTSEVQGLCSVQCCAAVCSEILIIYRISGVL